MEKDYQNNNSISDAANNNEESNKPEHEIKVEIVSIEVVGEDTPPKHSKKYERWGDNSLVVLLCLGCLHRIQCLQSPINLRRVGPYRHISIVFLIYWANGVS